MTSAAVSRQLEIPGVGTQTRAFPARLVEYGYYTVLLYSLVAPGLGIQIPLGSGGLLLMLAAFCVMKLRVRALVAYARLKLPFACTLSFLMVDFTVHGGSLGTEMSRTLIVWCATLIIVQTLSGRQEFLHRCAIFLWLIGLATLPFLTHTGASGGSARIAVDRSIVSGGLGNPNGFGNWFGFCCLYFSIVGIETRRTSVRVASGLAAIVCLYFVGLTVSRGALLGTVLGVTIGLRRILRRGFIPLLLLVLVAGVSFGLGLFDETISSYTARGTEDTGRFEVWPLAIERFVASPLFGVGPDYAATPVPGHKYPVAPHNTFLFVALSAGVIPLAFLVAWYVWMGRNSLTSAAKAPDKPFQLPLLAYALINDLFGDLVFMMPWAVLSLAFATNARSELGSTPQAPHRREVPIRVRRFSPVRSTPSS